jgi:hypothetical protein
MRAQGRWRYYSAVDPRSQFDMTADGERFLVISTTSGNVDTARMIPVQNWFEELKSRVP